MASLISNGWSWVKGKARLIIEFAIIFAMVAVLGYATSLWWRQRQLDDQVSTLSTSLGSVSETLQQQVRANEDQDKAIAEVKRLRELDGQALEQLHGELTKADTRGDALRRKVAELEKNNADAKALLDTAVPPAVGCVLDGTPCPGAGGDNPNGGGDAQAR